MKTLKEWDATGGDFTDYCQPGDSIDNNIFYYFFGVVPPVSVSKRGFLMGECVTHNAEGEGIYDCFTDYPYKYCGQMTLKEFQSKEILCPVGSTDKEIG